MIDGSTVKMLRENPSTKLKHVALFIASLHAGNASALVGARGPIYSDPENKGPCLYAPILIVGITDRSVYQHQCSNDPNDTNQTWFLKAVAGNPGVYLIKHALAGCLQGAGSGQSPTVAPCNKNSQSFWWRVAPGGIFYQLRNQETFLCLTSGLDDHDIPPTMKACDRRKTDYTEFQEFQVPEISGMPLSRHKRGLPPRRLD